MAKFSTNPSRADPYKNFKFRIKWDGRYVAGVSKASPLKRSTRKMPGLQKSGAVTLERGITQDREFESWATSPKELRRDIVIDVFNEAGKLAISYKLNGCWVSELQAAPELDADANAVAIESMKLENEGWEQIDVSEKARSS